MKKLFLTFIVSAAFCFASFASSSPVKDFSLAKEKFPIKSEKVSLEFTKDVKAKLFIAVTIETTCGLQVQFEMIPWPGATQEDMEYDLGDASKNTDTRLA